MKFWWIALLHHVEEDIEEKGGDSLTVLTRVRKLYYDDKNWNRLIDREDVTPLFTWDKSTGAIVMHSGVPREVLFALGRRYKMNGDKFVVKNGDREMTDRHDYVILADGREMMIGHVLTGLESAYFKPSFMGNMKFNYPRSATTWAGDMGQAVTWTITAKRDGQFTDINGTTVVIAANESVHEAWFCVRDTFARPIELFGDVYGYYLGSEKRLVKGKSEPRLSSVLEDLFYNPKRDWIVGTWFSELGAVIDKKAEISDFAEVWDDLDAQANFDDDDEDHMKLVDAAVEYLAEVVKSMTA